MSVVSFRVSSPPEPQWRPLWIFLAYRLLVAAVLPVVFFTRLGPGLLGKHDPTLFGWVSLAYLGLVFASGVLAHHQSPELPRQASWQVLADILCITLLMHASGGVQSGLGILLVPTIAGGSLLVEGRTALLLAALGTMALLGEQLYAQVQGVFGGTAYTQAGALGAALFATALVALVLAQRVQVSEQIAQRRRADILSLAELNAHIIQRMQAGVIVVDNDNRIRLINRAARGIFGLSEGGVLNGVRRPAFLRELAPELERRLLELRRLPTGAPLGFLAQFGPAELLVRFTRIENDPSSATLIFLEDSDDLLRQAQQMKLASLGRLTASIAHEIRNPLGAISHAAQLLGEADELRREDRRLIQIIRDQSRRMNGIIESVLQLSRPSAVRPERLALYPWLLDFVEEWLAMHHLEPERVRVSVAPEDVQVNIDPSHLRQVLTNLAENAYQHGGGADGRPVVDLRGGDREGPYLDVVDSGPGIDAQSARHIFEPFFTRRADGTGLGLYIARELCASNNARLEYFPNPEGGSCFRIRFAKVEEQGLVA